VVVSLCKKSNWKQIITTEKSISVDEKIISKKSVNSINVFRLGWYLMKNSTPRLLGNADNLSENFDARVNISLYMAPLTFLVGRA
jgi:hypothetical protein